MANANILLKYFKNVTGMQFKGTNRISNFMVLSDKLRFNFEGKLVDIYKVELRKVLRIQNYQSVK